MRWKQLTPAAGYGPNMHLNAKMVNDLQRVAFVESEKFDVNRVDVLERRIV